MSSSATSSSSPSSSSPAVDAAPAASPHSTSTKKEAEVPTTATPAAADHHTGTSGEQQQQQHPSYAASSLSYNQQIEDANKELEAAIAANESFRKNILEAPSSLRNDGGGGGDHHPILPSSATYRTGSYSNSLLAKWASIPAPQQQPNNNNNNNNTTASTTSTSTSASHHSRVNLHQSRFADPNSSNHQHHQRHNNPSSASYLYRPACQCDDLDRLISEALAKEAQRVDNEIRDVIARDGDARSQHLDNVLRGRFAELQAHNESTGKVLQLIGDSLKNIKAENSSLAKLFEEKTSHTLETVKQHQKDQTNLFESSLERIERRINNLEETMQQERVARQTRLDALELRMQELRSSVFSHVEKNNSQVRDEIRSLDADFASLHRDWAKSSGVNDDIRHVKEAMREMIDDSTGLRSDIRQLKSDVLNLDVFMKVKAQNASFSSSSTLPSSTSGGGKNDSRNKNVLNGIEAAETLQALRESVSYLAAAMKHHGILSVEGPSISEILGFAGGRQQQQSSSYHHQQHTTGGSRAPSSTTSTNPPHHNSNSNNNNFSYHHQNQPTSAFTTSSTRHATGAGSRSSSYDFLYNQNVADHNNNNNNNNVNSDDAHDATAAAAAAGSSSIRTSNNIHQQQNNIRRSSASSSPFNNSSNNNTIPPLHHGTSTPKNQTSSYRSHSFVGKQGASGQDDELAEGGGGGIDHHHHHHHEEQEDNSSGTLPSADEDDRLVRSPID